MNEMCWVIDPKAGKNYEAPNLENDQDLEDNENKEHNYLEDWYEICSTDDINEGCCLLCYNAAPGCLCYQCKCRNCTHYSYDREKEKGFCIIARERRMKKKC
jgi:hypothetical protein